MDRMFDDKMPSTYFYSGVGKQPLYEKYEAKVKNICVRLERARKKSMDKVKKIEERIEREKAKELKMQQKKDEKNNESL